MKFQFVNKMIHDLNEIPDISLQTFQEEDITNKDILNIILKKSNFKRSHVWGDPALGEPIQYSKFIVIDDFQSKTFEYYNMGIHYMLNYNEELRKIFKVFSYFADKTGGF